MTRRSRIQPGSKTIGTGLPVASNTHEVAQSLAPESRVVYVDNDRCEREPRVWPSCDPRSRPRPFEPAVLMEIPRCPSWFAKGTGTL